jgi:hypothetical protein
MAVVLSWRRLNQLVSFLSWGDPVEWSLGRADRLVSTDRALVRGFAVPQWSLHCSCSEPLCVLCGGRVGLARAVESVACGIMEC